MSPRKRLPEQAKGAHMLLLEYEGSDPRPALQLPDLDIECAEIGGEQLDAAAIVYSHDSGETDDGTEINAGFVGVLCIVVAGATGEECAQRILASGAQVANSLLGGVAKGGKSHG